jgi:16S rRNA (guanine1207-N2)-methyltransferase
MHPRSKLIERNSEQFLSYKKLLVISPPAHDDLSYLGPEKVFTFDYRTYKSLEPSLHEKIRFSLDSDDISNCDAAIIHIPKSKGELELVLAFVAPMLTVGGSIYLAGEKKSGIASAAKKLEKYGTNCSKIDSAKHCQLWHVSLDVEAPRFDLSDWISFYDVAVNDISMRVATIPGVFSAGELDLGTELLLSNMFTRLEGRVLDFGCGSGVLGCYTKLLNPSIKLEMVDISLLAIKCAEQTALVNQLDVQIYPSDGWAEVKGRVNALVTNPPFHQGVDTEYSTTESFIKGAKDKMAKHAPFLLVANSFLKYPSLIEAAFGRCDILAETSKFRVYKAFR